MEKKFGIILAVKDYEPFLKQQKELIKEIEENFEKVFIINVYNLKLLDNNNHIPINHNLFPKNFECLNFKKSNEFLKFFKNKDFVALQFLDKNPSFFKIFFLIKLANIKNILIMNLGDFGNSQTIDWNPKHIFAFKHYFEKGFYYVFRILTILNIFPKIDLLFEANTNIIKAIKNGFSRKFEKKYPFFKVSYFRKIENINSLFYDDYIKKKLTKVHINKKMILYVDVPIDHGDRVNREGKIPNYIKEEFYKNLKMFLKKIEITLKMNLVIGLHPSNKNGKNVFSGFNISRERTTDLIPKSDMIIFIYSSLINKAALFKKKMICIESKYLGNYIGSLTNKYKKALHLNSFNIDNKFNLEKKNIIRAATNSIRYYNKFISKNLNADGNNLSNKKIIRRIKEIFFI
jgi:hypothetical protein